MELLLLDPDLLHMLYKFRPELLEHLNESDPVIYSDGDNVCCISGSEAADQILGYGTTVELAIEDWDKSYQQAHRII